MGGAVLRREVRRPYWPCALAALLVLALAPIASAHRSTGGLRLGPVIRLTTPSSLGLSCPNEGEAAVAVVDHGTWVAYNDDHTCPISPDANLRLTSLQFIDRTGHPHYVQLTASQGGYLSGDPALAPDPRHSDAAVLATMEVFGDYSKGLGVYRVRPTGSVASLRFPHISGATDDKDAIAVDPVSGNLYVAWDQTTARGTSVVVRRYAHDRWSREILLAAGPGWPDVTVSVTGEVAVAYASARGIKVRQSDRSWDQFSKPKVVIPGQDPGSLDPACPLRRTVGVRQRVSAAPRLVFDSAGGLNVAAALRRTTSAGSQVLWTRGRDGNWPAAKPVASTTHDQFNVAMSASPGAVAVSWLETTDQTGLFYEPEVAILPATRSEFRPPVSLMSKASKFPAATEAYGNSECYGVGDYVGLASHKSSFVAAWPATVDQAAWVLNSDVYARRLTPTTSG